MQLKIIALAILPFALAAPMVAKGRKSIRDPVCPADDCAVDIRDTAPAPAADANLVAKAPVQDVDSALIKYMEDVIEERN
ncbi:hypothetical protein BU26DRAFT_520579 [Trematosphaeria pertusa]|uniref:Uncharacterized protein n=1 Tax=Trematosphaeria pertusa TaxID=390896 RepID=A0A6A6IA08_9PLEO|nr:uncharacterized protein BU26DRAFT_520579 [Trematosphaeria pertusa]KAF2247405.1 hypothetical protein BU26DRAFT_520579 [Trematosphaeria pertusa]